MSTPMPPAVPRRVLGTILVVVSCALALALVLMQGNELWLPPALQPLGHTLYRLTYWLTLPAQWALLLVHPSAHHHVPASNAPGAAALTAIGMGLAWWGFTTWQATAATQPDTPDPLRRDLLGRITMGLAGLGVLHGAGLATWGVLVEPSRLAVRRYEIPIRGLPAWAEGLRIVQLSDTHYGPYVSLPYLRRAVAMANALEADLAVLTGDYVHRTSRAIPGGIGLFSGLKARLGRFAVLGNHDHWAGAEACREAFQASGTRLLDRQHVHLGPQGVSDAPQDDSLCLAGFGDLWEDEHPPQVALEGVNPGTPRIVLSHNPDYAERIPEGLRVDLMISGHTHGGQVYVPGKGTPKVPSNYGQWYAGGICQGPRCPVVVSRGVGMAYLPVRLGVRPEIVLITLTRAPETP
jgi:predicted MPP superfamily phosphohydrolase